jgi:hypothetical protein
LWIERIHNLITDGKASHTFADLDNLSGCVRQRAQAWLGRNRVASPHDGQVTRVQRRCADANENVTWPTYSEGVPSPG